MISTPNKVLDVNPALLGAFVRAVATAGDSPTVIRRVTENAAYVKLILRLATLEADAEPLALLVEACRKADITLPRLRARLAPVAKALGLGSKEDQVAYYRVLGVAPDSDAEAIRSAYRRRVRELHPDLQPDQGTDALEFIALTKAYATLRNPTARQAYDARCRAEGTWFEPSPQHPPPKATRRYSFRAVVVVVVLVAVALVLDQLERESAQRIAVRISRSVDTHPVAPPPTQLAPQLPGATGPALEPVPSDAVNPIEASLAEPEGAENALAPAPVLRTETLEPEYVLAPEQEPPQAAPGLEAQTALSTARTAQPTEARRSENNIRYFNAADRKAAIDLQSALRRFMADLLERPKMTVRLIDLSSSYPNAKAWHLEIGLNAEAAAQDAAVPDVRPTPPQSTAQAAAAAPPSAKPSTEDRIRRFLGTYCRTYESLAPDRLADLFEPTATENGQPFVELLPRYRENMDRMATISYRIAMESWQPVQDGAGFAVQGRFTARGEFTDRREYRSKGSIRLTLVPHTDAFRVARLDYAIDYIREKIPNKF